MWGKGRHKQPSEGAVSIVQVDTPWLGGRHTVARRQMLGRAVVRSGQTIGVF